MNASTFVCNLPFDLIFASLLFDLLEWQPIKLSIVNTTNKENNFSLFFILFNNFLILCLYSNCIFTFSTPFPN